MTPDQPKPSAAPWTQAITLAAGFAHEIKNPLSTITLNLQLLQEDWREPQTPKEKRTLKRLQTLQLETARLAGLLEDFLRYARTHVVEPEPCDLNRLVQEILDFIAPQAMRQGIDIHTTLQPGLPPLSADPKLLKQALLNLVINAEEAMPGGGELLVRTARDGDGVRVDITDTGCGIAPQHLGRVFDIYFSTKQKGSGLGLPATRRVVELHGGTIDVESELGKGTHFAIRLPVQPPGTRPEEDRP